jgi:hypothetical protein
MRSRFTSVSRISVSHACNTPNSYSWIAVQKLVLPEFNPRAETLILGPKLTKSDLFHWGAYHHNIFLFISKLYSMYSSYISPSNMLAEILQTLYTEKLLLLDSFWSMQRAEKSAYIFQLSLNFFPIEELEHLKRSWYQSSAFSTLAKLADVAIRGREPSMAILDKVSPWKL